MMSKTTEPSEQERAIFSLSLGLNKDVWGSRMIRETVIELGETLIEFQETLIPNMVTKYGEDNTVKKLEKFNELLEGFRFAKAGRPRVNRVNGGENEDE